LGVVWLFVRTCIVGWLLSRVLEWYTAEGGGNLGLLPYPDPSSPKGMPPHGCTTLLPKRAAQFSRSLKWPSEMRSVVLIGLSKLRLAPSCLLFQVRRDATSNDSEKQA